MLGQPRAIGGFNSWDRARRDETSRKRFAQGAQLDVKLPADDVLRDEMGSLGVPEADREEALRVFAANLEYAGLVKELSGAKRII